MLGFVGDRRQQFSLTFLTLLELIVFVDSFEWHVLSNFFIKKILNNNNQHQKKDDYILYKKHKPRIDEKMLMKGGRRIKFEGRRIVEIKERETQNGRVIES